MGSSHFRRGIVCAKLEAIHQPANSGGEERMQATTIGLDLAKNVFQVHGEDAHGKVVVRKRLTRGQVLRWFANTPVARVGIEACGGAHYWARELIGLGHDVRILPPQYVKPFVKTNKSDAADAEAICRAVGSTRMPTVAVASPAQQDMQALHRVRQRLMANRTALGNQTRGLLLEYGIAVPKGMARLREGVRLVLERPSASLSATFLALLQEQYSELLDWDRKIAHYTARIERAVEADPAARRLRAVPGIGALTASALLTKAGAGAYGNGRHFAAALGLVPRHEGTGGKLRLLGISKRGDRYLRCLLIHGARAVVSQMKDKQDPLRCWLRRLVERRGHNKAVVALANKNARIAWALIAGAQEYAPQRACAQPMP